MAEVKIGDKIRIINMYDSHGTDILAHLYNGEEGVVESIDSLGQLHGTWGGLAIIPEVDEFIVI